MTIHSIQYCNINIPFKVVDGKKVAVNIKPILLGLYSSGQPLLAKAKENPLAIVDPVRGGGVWVDLSHLGQFLSKNYTCNQKNDQADNFELAELSDLILDTLFDAGHTNFKSTKRLAIEAAEIEAANKEAAAEAAAAEAARQKQLADLQKKVADFEVEAKARVDKEKAVLAANVNPLIKFMHGAMFPVICGLIFSLQVGLFVYGTFVKYMEVPKYIAIGFAVSYALFAPVAAVRRYFLEFSLFGKNYRLSGFFMAGVADLFLVANHVDFPLFTSTDGSMPFLIQIFFISTFFIMMNGYYEMVLKIGNSYTQKGLLKTIE